MPRVLCLAASVRGERETLKIRVWGRGLQAAEDGAALILVNFELPRALMERLWFNATIRVCADGAINRLYATFDSEEERARFIPEYVRGDLDSVEQKVLDYYAGHGTLIIKDSDQDTTDLEKCILLILDNSTAYPQRQVLPSSQTSLTSALVFQPLLVAACDERP